MGGVTKLSLQLGSQDTVNHLHHGVSKLSGNPQLLVLKQSIKRGLEEWKPSGFIKECSLVNSSDPTCILEKNHWNWIFQHVSFLLKKCFIMKFLLHLWMTF